VKKIGTLHTTAGTTLAILLVSVAVSVTILNQAGAQESSTVWDGVYTEEQAVRGEQVYQDECTFCHLDDLQGDSFATPLIDDAFTVRWNGSNLGDLMIVIQVTMPADRPATLSNEAVADVIAFLLQMNDYPVGNDELQSDPDGLKSVIFTELAP
jgi:cytochrome c5